MRPDPQDPAGSLQESRRELREQDIAVHIFTASVAMVGVCLTVIGLFRISNKLRQIGTIGDELLAIDALAFLGSAFLAYLALRHPDRSRRERIERIADVIFLTALSTMVVVCALIAYELV